MNGRSAGLRPTALRAEMLSANCWSALLPAALATRRAGQLASAPPDLPSAAGIHVKHFDLDREDASLDCLSVDETARAAHFHFERDARRWAVGRSLLRSTLAEFLGKNPSALSFETGPFGKPHLPDCLLRFSVSHSGSALLIVLAWNKEVGVDIECLRGDFVPEELAAQVFSPKEQAAIERVPIQERHAAFLRQWTAKEAYVKSLGTGLSFPLSRLTLTPNAETDVYEAKDLTDAGTQAAISVCRLDCPPGFAASLAYVT